MSIIETNNSLKKDLSSQETLNSKLRDIPTIKIDRTNSDIQNTKAAKYIIKDSVATESSVCLIGGALIAGSLGYLLTESTHEPLIILPATVISGALGGILGAKIGADAGRNIAKRNLAYAELGLQPPQKIRNNSSLIDFLILEEIFNKK